ncbi:MAG: sulfurtransferase [candidate division WOR-3 bacterium]|nr:sulfurtransferase [candidate division WOR-3 bacterium]MCX7947144.1 sulfurtransferase [candidate division WOR-3 bacterium]MDW8150200.1 sulfurtransferase [candidate division WOR-3 bacterium]
MLVSTRWVYDNINNPEVRILEVSEDEHLYDEWHIPNALKLSWKDELRSKEWRDFINKTEFEELMSKKGISNTTKVVLYGDKSNWFACNGYWLFKYYGHPFVYIMDGGRKKWEIENLPKSKEVPIFNEARYIAKQRDETIRAYLWEIKRALAENRKDFILVDIRSPMEYSGEINSILPEEGAYIGGHIPGAVNIPWNENINDKDWTFKSRDELLKLYESKGVTRDKEVITYCRIGERSALTWFVIKEILNYPRVKNYDGSWTEWGNSVRTRIKRGYEP